MKRGKLLVISGPSGCGKSTVIGKMMAGRENVEFSVSATTRHPRPGEREGVDYFFVSRERFEEMLRNDELLEHAEFVGNCYGTPKSQVCARLESGVSVILDIEVQEAARSCYRVPCSSGAGGAGTPSPRPRDGIGRDDPCAARHSTARDGAGSKL